ncbi:MAG: GDP-L-fucose synthase [Deltaproteobacteria bacterium]|nr:GDP-L-fucose synthase [Deltaproteobacteria bacterium]
MLKPDDKIFVAGHRGLVGSAAVCALKRSGYENIVTRSRAELELTRPTDVAQFFAETRPDVVVVAAARVGGINANRHHPIEFLYENTMIAMNVIHAAACANVTHLLFLGSSCIYPKQCPQPIAESALLSGPLEPTNEAYAIAKIAGLKLCEAFARQSGRHFFSLMPTNLYGPNDNFDPWNAHVIPGMMRRFHEAKVAGLETVSIWGSGQALREFMHVDDLASAIVVALERHPPGGEAILNVGTGHEISIEGLAKLMREVVGYEGVLTFDPTQPDGTPRKLLNSERMRALGWSPSVALRDGLEATYEWAVSSNVFEPPAADADRSASSSDRPSLDPGQASPPRA